MAGMKKRVMARKPFKSRKRFKPDVYGRVRRPLAEKKYVDTSFGFTVSTTATVSPLNLIASGTDDFQRIGNQINLIYCQVRLWFNQTPPVAAVRNDYVRVSIVYDRQTNGALPAYATVFQDVDNAGTGTSNPFSFTNRDTKHRFKVLMSETFFLPGVSTVAAASFTGSTEEGAGFLRINKFLKCGGFLSRYIGNTAAIADLESGSLLLLTQTQTLAAGSSPTILQGTIRVGYGDK